MKQGSIRLSRRSFFRGMAAAAVLSGLSSVGAAEAPSNREKLHELDYSAVRITAGPLREQFDRIHAAYLALDNDRLLKVYRQRAGLPAPGEDMGGWYNADGFVPGHSLGQYISGLSRFARATGSRATYEKVAQLVNGFAETLGPGGYPYASAKASATWPCYILDKFEIGLLDAYRLVRVSSARGLLARVIRGAMPYLPPRVHDRVGVKHAPYDEPYILPENLFNTVGVTGEKELLAMARKYLLNREYFDPLARGINVLPGKHAYSHVMALSSAAKAFQVDGEPQYLETLRNAWDMLEKTQEYGSGGWGPNEAFVEPGEGKLGESLTSTHAHFETPCGCYAHFKLARYLLCFTGEARYGDGLERVLYNTVLGAKDPSGDGRFFYYSDYHPSARKSYYPHRWPCCSGTLVQDVADYLLGIYFRSHDGIYVNLFVPSEADVSVKGVPVKIIQTTRYPQDGEIELRIETPAPTTFTVYARIPGWLEAPATVSINGKAIDLKAERHTFMALRRRWKRNDTIQIKFPLRLRAEAVDSHHAKTVAVIWGPVMLVGVNPPPGLFADPLPIPQGLQPVPYNPLRFEMDRAGKRLRFAPFFSVGDGTYTTYFLKT
jgi:hypothetical protein